MENKIVCLCGSLRFKKIFEDVEFELVKNGYVVLLPACMFVDMERKKEYMDYKKIVDELHKRKIEIADIIYVIDEGGYIGESTKKEVEFARILKKKIYFFSTGDFLW